MKTQTIDREALVSQFIEVKLVNGDKDFLIVKETLSRIGIPSYKGGKNSLFQTCHILHKKGRYYIVHFKELFMLDNKLKSPMTAEDYQRRTYIALLLEKWGLVDIVSNVNRQEDFNLRKLGLRVVPFSKKSHWNLQSKYFIGKVKNFRKQEELDEEEYND